MEMRTGAGPKCGRVESSQGSAVLPRPSDWAAFQGQRLVEGREEEGPQQRTAARQSGKGEAGRLGLGCGAARTLAIPEPGNMEH